MYLTTSIALVAGDDLQPPLSLRRSFGQPLQTSSERLRRHRAAETLHSLGLSRKGSSRLLPLLLTHHTHALQPFFQQLQDTFHGRHIHQETPATLDEVPQVQVTAMGSCWTWTQLPAGISLVCICFSIQFYIRVFCVWWRALTVHIWVGVFLNRLHKISGGQKEQGEDVLKELKAKHGWHRLQIELTLWQIVLELQMANWKRKDQLF